MDTTVQKTNEFKRVLVWELPVRIFHWLNVICITVLAVTGFIIADPPAIMSSAEAVDSYWFGTVRMIHFTTAYIFLSTQPPESTGRSTATTIRIGELSVPCQKGNGTI